MALAAAGFAGAGLLGAGAAGLMKQEKTLSQAQLGQLRGGLSNAGGLSTRNVGENRQVQIEVDPARQALVEGPSKSFTNQARLLGDLRSKLAPGMGALTAARRRNFEAGKSQALGDLRSNLARRRVMGSSFGADAQTAVSEQYDRALAELDAQSFMEELGLNLDLLNQQSAAARSAFETKLNELSLQTNVRLAILNGSQAGVADLAKTSANISAMFKGAVVDSLGFGFGGAAQRLGGPQAAGGAS